MEYVTTEEVAGIFGVRPQTLRAGLCRDGEYMGVRPFKRPNGRLSWVKAEVIEAADRIGRAQYKPNFACNSRPELGDVADDLSCCTLVVNGRRIRFVLDETYNLL